MTAETMDTETRSGGSLGTSTVSRRKFLAAGGVGVATATTMAVTGFGTRLALAAPGDPSTGDVLVVVFLRGGADGLTMAPPYGYQSYRQLRPNIAIDPPGGPNGALPLTGGSANGNAVFPTGLDGVIGLHPALKPAYDALWDRGRLAVIPATGLPPSESPTRSHFAATRYVQAGSASGSVGGGWLGRMINVQSGDGLFPALNTTNRGNLLQGGKGAVSIPNLRNFGITGFPDRDRASDALNVLHSGNDSISARGSTVLGVVDRVQNLGNDLRPGYPNDQLSRKFSEVSELIKANLGIRAAVIDFGSWDHHRNHGTVGNGRFHRKATELGGALGAFANDTNGLDGICVLVITEFGRTINENGNRGTDHGRATTYMAMGSGIRGGVFGDDYPDVIRDDPNHGDLTVLTDFRKPVAEIIRNRAMVNDLGVVFPTYQGQGELGLTR